MSTEFDFRFDDVDNELEFEAAPEPEEAEPEAPEQEESELQNSEYLAIYDSIMFEDKYEKMYKLGKSYTATFSTRSAEADLTISRQIDGMNFSTMQALQTMSAILTMSHSLVELNGADLRKMKVAERYAYIRSKSSHLIELLSRHMVSFDRLVREALEYGEENF